MKEVPKQKAHSPYFTLKILGFVLFSIVAIRLVIFHTRPNIGNASDLTVQNIIEAINKERSLRNLSTLNTDNRLSTAAQSKSEDMITRKYFAHVDPDGNYIWPKIVEAGYTPYLQLGENLAIEFYNTESLVSAWMNSPTHRANVLNEQFKDQGMGLFFGNVSNGEYHSSITNTFGSLVVKKTEPKPAPTTPPSDPSTSSGPTAGSGSTTPQPSSSPEIIPKPTTPTETPTTPVVETPKEEPKKTEIAIRTGSASGQKNYATPEVIDTSTTTQDNLGTSSKKSVSKTNLFSNLTQKPFAQSRNISLALGGMVAILLVSDIKNLIQKKTGGFDKKINNFVLLILALLAVGFMYWV
jgi:hypothetical protein